MPHNNESAIQPNVLTLIALCNEYCQAIENTRETEPDDFIAQITKLLPRIYITAASIQDSTAALVDDDDYIDNSALDEDYYDAIRRNIENLMGENDTYLEVFEQDMKYSDTPIASSISENLADIFQVAYNFIESVKEARTEYINAAANAFVDDFANYWSRILVNVMRPLNALRYNI